MSVLRPEGTLDIYVASDFHAQVAQQLTAGSVAIDLSALQGIDGAGVQLLLWAEAAAERQGAHFSIAAASEPVRQVFEFLHVFPGQGA